MNAVLTKPRARASKRSSGTHKPAASTVTIADIRNWITLADEKLEMAYDAAERGEPIDTLLDHINHCVLVTPQYTINRDDLTQADASRIYRGLFPVLACLQGAIRLAGGTVLQATLEEAFALLDAAQTALDPVNEAVRILPEGGPAHEFERGRDLAIRFINEGSTLSGQRDCYRDHRDPGTAQKDFASDYLMEATEAREMLGGFAAVLSQVIGSGEGFDGEFFEKLTLAETETGVTGSDGTRCEESESAPAISRKMDFEATGIEENAYFMISEVIAIIQSRLHDVGEDILYGALYVAERAYAILGSGVAARSIRMCKDASAPLAVAIAVLEAALQVHDDMALQGARRLLSLAQEILDKALGEAA
jgi:hypothetical protein